VIKENGEALSLKIATKDGKHHSVTLDFRGIPSSQAQVEDKFLGLTSPVLGSEKARKVVDMVASLEKLTNVNKLADLLNPV